MRRPNRHMVMLAGWLGQGLDTFAYAHRESQHSCLRPDTDTAGRISNGTRVKRENGAPRQRVRAPNEAISRIRTSHFPTRFKSLASLISNKGIYYIKYSIYYVTCGLGPVRVNIFPGVGRRS